MAHNETGSFKKIKKKLITFYSESVVVLKDLRNTIGEWERRKLHQALLFRVSTKPPIHFLPGIAICALHEVLSYFNERALYVFGSVF